MIRVRRSWVLRLASALIGTTLLLTALELTWRVLPVGEPVPRVLPTHNDPIARFHPNEQWIFSLGWDFFIVNEQRTNSAGWISHIGYSREGDAPLLAVVGDSFVQGDYVPWPDTCHGKLAIKLDGLARVYSFGYNAAPLSQYLGYAQYIRDTYRPDALAIPIIENDFDESFARVIKAGRESTFFTFVERRSGDLVLAPPARRPEGDQDRDLSRRLDNWLRRNSRLYRYYSNHVGNRLSWRRESTDDGPERVALAHRATDAFLRMLPERSGLDPDRIVFVVDAPRPMSYAKGWEHAFDGTYHDLARRYFIERARAGGYEVIDMQPVFVDHYRSHQQPFNWTRDKHWNSLDHGLCADQVALSAVLRRMLSATGALETN